MDDTVAAICQACSAVVLVMAMVMKLPQIRNVIKVGHTQGISLKSLLAEFWCFTILFAYPCAQGYPIGAYIDMLMLVIQDLILLLLVMMDRELMTLRNTAILTTYLSIIFAVAMAWLPTWVLYTMSSTVTPIGPIGKLMQVWTIVANKDAGSVSVATWGIGSVTAAMRVFTSAMLTQDRFLMFMSSQAAILNGLICLCAIIYKREKVKQQ